MSGKGKVREFLREERGSPLTPTKPIWFFLSGNVYHKLESFAIFPERILIQFFRFLVSANAVRKMVRQRLSQIHCSPQCTNSDHSMPRKGLVVTYLEDLSVPNGRVKVACQLRGYSRLESVEVLTLDVSIKLRSCRRLNIDTGSGKIYNAGTILSWQQHSPQTLWR